jgi:hypothetical protein
LLLVLACVLTAAARAQSLPVTEQLPLTADSNAPPAGAARKVDEYGKIGHCDETARLDSFAMELRNDPSAKGYLVIYAGKDDLPSWTEGILGRAASYLVNARGLAPARVKVIDGGRRDERTAELWVVPETGTPPQPSNAVEYKLDRTKAYQWDEDAFDISYQPDDTGPDAADAEDSDPQGAEGEPAAADKAADAQSAEAESAEEAAWRSDYEKHHIEVVAHGLIEYEPEPEESDAHKTGGTPAGIEAAAEQEDEPTYGDTTIGLSWNVEKLSQELKEVPDARLCLVYYWGLKAATRERVREVVERAIVKTEEQTGVKRDRIILIDGGRSRDPGIELWVVPRGAEPPTPRPEQKRKFGFYSAPGEE